MPSRAHALIEESLANEPFAHSLLSDEPNCSTSNDSHKGTVLHKLFEVLPDVEPSRQNEVALEYLQRTLPNFGHTEHAAIVENVQSVLSDESLAPCFQPETSRAEVPIMGIVSLPSRDRSVSGTVDRLAVLDDRVIILDFKTGRYVPKNADVIPQDYALQMALYAMLLSQIYPEKSVEPVIVWTTAAEGARIMRLPDAALEEARGQLSRL